MDFLQEFLYFAFDAAATLLLFATWQQTRIIGFLVLASSYVLGILIRWMIPLLYRVFSDADGLSFIIQSVWMVVAAVSLYGLWDIYRQLKRPENPAPPTV